MHTYEIYIYIHTCVYTHTHMHTISKFLGLKKCGTELKHWDKVHVSRWARAGWRSGFRKDFVTRWRSPTWKDSLEFVHFITESGHSRERKQQAEREEWHNILSRGVERSTQEEQARADYKQPRELYRDVTPCPGAAPITWFSSRGRWGFQ